MAIFEVFLSPLGAKLGVIHESLLVSARIRYHKGAHYRGKAKSSQTPMRG